MALAFNVFDAYSAVLFLPGADGDVCRAAASFSLGDALDREVAIAPGMGLVGWIIRESKPLLIVDIALPRDFDPEIGALPGVTVKNIYNLREVVDANLKRREQGATTAEQIIEEELRKFTDWQRSLRITSAIEAIRRHVEDIRREELAKCRHHFQDDAFGDVEKLTSSIAGKYMHALVAQLKALHEANLLDAENMRAIERLFDIKQQKS